MCICPPCVPAIQEVLLQLQGLRRKESTPARAPSIPEQLQQATGYREETPQCQPQALEDPAVCLKQLKPASSVDQETHFRSMHILYPCLNVLYIYNTIYNNRMTACMYTCRQKKMCTSTIYSIFSGSFFCLPLCWSWLSANPRAPDHVLVPDHWTKPSATHLQSFLPWASHCTKDHQGSPRITKVQR